MHYCQNCGYQMTQGSRICPNCRTPTPLSPQPPQGTQYSPTRYQKPLQSHAPPESKLNTFFIIVIIILLLIILYTALYFLVLAFSESYPGSFKTAPVGAFDFIEISPGNYTGDILALSEDLPLSDCSITIFDASDASSASQGPPVQSGVPIATSEGFSLKFTDTNDNNQIDTGDVWTLENAAENDEIRLIHDTGKAIAIYTIS